MLPPDPGRQLPLYMHALGETLAIAFLGTFAGAVLALPFGFLAAKNVVANPALHFTVPPACWTRCAASTKLIWALIYVTVVGLGPFAGILAIANGLRGRTGQAVSPRRWKRRTGSP